MTKTAAAQAAEAKQRVNPLTVDQVAKALEQGEVSLLDLREPGERAQQGAIPGAVSAPWGMLAFWDELTEAHYRAKLNPRGRVVLCCAAGVRSTMAAGLLQRMGYANVTYLKGGVIAWQTGGRPVEDAAVRVTRTAASDREPIPEFGGYPHQPSPNAERGSEAAAVGRTTVVDRRADRPQTKRGHDGPWSAALSRATEYSATRLERRVEMRVCPPEIHTPAT